MINPNIKGLTKEQVQERIQQGKHNQQPQSLTPSIGQIIRKNTLTLFNLINILLAAAILYINEPRHILFLGVAICNTLMGIFQELRSKRTLDKLSILAQAKATVIRDGQAVSINQDEVVIDDVIYIETGNQICADSETLQSEGFEVDESLLTGESDKILKNTGDKVMSGSFAVSGHGYAKVTAVGKDNYATALTMEAKKEKRHKSKLLNGINNIIRMLTIVIIPLGILLFFNQYDINHNLNKSILGASSGVLGMIPEGLILLTGVTLTVGALRLARKKALVQSLSSIETLARVDVLCLDKTGTITDGTLAFEKFILLDSPPENEIEYVVSEILGSLQDNNSTAKALLEHFGTHTSWKSIIKVPFSSARKWSGVSFDKFGSYILGAPGFVFPGGDHPFFAEVNENTKKGYRVLCLAHSPSMIENSKLPSDLNCIALLIMSDNIRKEAPDTFRFFRGEGVTLKVISGDDPVTVSVIASKAGIEGADLYIDMSSFKEEEDFSEIVEKYVVFGRVSPQQKRELIAALRKNGHTACMTGDGVNDILAMKEADCSVAMINGSDAARGACDFVLMTSDFSAMEKVLHEGRRVINNIETVSSLYLVKTIYSTILSILYIFIPQPYPFVPLQMMPINSFTVGIPSFFLALRKNFKKPDGRFFKNVLENSLPAAITIVLSIIFLQIAGFLFKLSPPEISTMNVIVTGAVGFAVLFKIAKPLDLKTIIVFSGLIICFIIPFIFFGKFFNFQGLFSRNMYFYLPLLYIGPSMFILLNSFIKKIEGKFKKK